MSEDLNKHLDAAIATLAAIVSDAYDDIGAAHQEGGKATEADREGARALYSQLRAVTDLRQRLQAAEERAEKAEIDLAVIHRAAQHCCGRFGGRMSEVDRIFQEITRVSSMHKTRAALKTEGA